MNVLLADPPWPYRVWSGKDSRTADAHYPTMTMQEMIDMRPMIDELAGDNAALFMWSTAPTMAEYAFPLMAAWGFQYKTFGLVWVKVNKKPMPKVRSEDYPAILTRDGFHKPFIGLGHYTRSNVEVALLGIRGRAPAAKGLAETQLIISSIREHSRKPDEQYGKIERLYPEADRKIELFARQQRAGWESWGNETGKFSDD